MRAPSSCVVVIEARELHEVSSAGIEKLLLYPVWLVRRDHGRNTVPSSAAISNMALFTRSGVTMMVVMLLAWTGMSSESSF